MPTSPILTKRLDIDRQQSGPHARVVRRYHQKARQKDRSYAEKRLEWLKTNDITASERIQLKSLQHLKQISSEEKLQQREKVLQERILSIETQDAARISRTEELSVNIRRTASRVPFTGFRYRTSRTRFGPWKDKTPLAVLLVKQKWQALMRKQFGPDKETLDLNDEVWTPPMDEHAGHNHDLADVLGDLVSEMSEAGKGKVETRYRPLHVPNNICWRSVQLESSESNQEKPHAEEDSGGEVDVDHLDAMRGESHGEELYEEHCDSKEDGKDGFRHETSEVGSFERESA